MANTSGSQFCGICESPIRAEIETALDQKEPLRSIAARSGHSRASLSRHNRKCRGRQAIAEYKEGKFNPLTQSVWTEWPDGHLARQSVPSNFQGTLSNEPGPDDVIVKVTFENPVAPRVLPETKK